MRKKPQRTLVSIRYDCRGLLNIFIIRILIAFKACTENASENSEIYPLFFSSRKCMYSIHLSAHMKSSLAWWKSTWATFTTIVPKFNAENLEILKYSLCIRSLFFRSSLFNFFFNPHHHYKSWFLFRCGLCSPFYESAYHYRKFSTFFFIFPFKLSLSVFYCDVMSNANRFICLRLIETFDELTTNNYALKLDMAAFTEEFCVLSLS